TRKNIFISLGLFFIALSLIKAVAASITQILVDLINAKAGIDTFMLLHLSYYTDDTLITRIFIDTYFMLLILSALFVSGLLFYKYDLAGWGSVICVIVILMLTGLAQGWLIDFFIDIFQSIDRMLFGKLLVLGIVIYSFSMILLRRITIVK